MIVVTGHNVSDHWRTVCKDYNDESLATSSMFVKASLYTTIPRKISPAQIGEAVNLLEETDNPASRHQHSLCMLHLGHRSRYI